MGEPVFRLFNQKRYKVMQVFEYINYLDFLNDWCSIKRSENKNWSLGSLARKLELSNTAAITNILKGRKIPSHPTVKKLAEVIKLNQREENYLKSLIEKKRYEKNSVLHSALNRFIGTIKPKSSQKQLETEDFNIISHPLYFVIREMIKLKDFKLDFTWIKDNLYYDVSTTELKKAFKKLEEVGLIAKTNNEYQQTVDFHETTTNISSEVIKDYHKKCLTFSIKQIDKVSTDKRHITSDTIALKEEQIQQLKDLMESFRKEVTSTHDTDQAEYVYHFNMQLIPATGNSNE
ncbi:MAG: hypothetical protein ACI9QD_000265 [Thermoproteota archaeon]|jgi:uncharacterized protein (TIGR02147 family)